MNRYLTYKFGDETVLLKWNEREGNVELIFQDSDGVTKQRFDWTLKTLIALAVLHREKTLKALPIKEFLKGGPRDLNGCPAPESYSHFIYGFTWSWSQDDKMFTLTDARQTVQLVPEVVQAFVDRYTA